jgi:hypothetical protein
MVYVARTGLEVPRPDILETSTTRSASREKQPMHYRRPRSAPITTNFVSILTRLQCTQTVVRTTIGRLEKCVAPRPIAMRSLPSEGGQHRWPGRSVGVFGRDVPWIGYPSPIDYEGEHALEPPAPASGPARPSRTSPAAGPQDGPSLAAAEHDGPSVVRAGNGE